MPILTAIGHNPWQRTYYQRLIARGKPPKLAIVASMRKLVTAIYSVAKSRTPFVSRDAREAFPPGSKSRPGVKDSGMTAGGPSSPEGYPSSPDFPTPRARSTRRPPIL